MEENIKISIEGEGLSLVKKISLKKAGQIISFLSLGEEAAKESDLLSVSVKKQPKELIEESNARTYAQKITALAAYLKSEGHEVFTPEDIKILFRKMGDEPKNFTRDFATAVDSQYIICTDVHADEFELTERGLSAIRDNFLAKVIRKNTGAKKPFTSKNIREEVKALEVVGVMEGFLPYHRIPTKSDKILWLLAYADKHGIRTLTPAELDYLSINLRDRVESGGFTALNGRNVKNSYDIKIGNGFQIQERGLEYLAGLSDSFN